MQNNKLGIIGGGQLGMLLIQSAIQFPVHVSVYDPDKTCPASYFASRFVEGSFDDKAALLEFGKSCDVLIFETERVNLDALMELEKMGKKVFSKPSDLAWIQDKYVQRKTLSEKGFKVPKFWEISANEVKSFGKGLPVVQKWRSGGYDGLGVCIHENEEDLKNAPEKDSVFEEKINIEMEISVIVARDENGKMAVYEPVEMIFDPEANLVDHLIAPARVSEEKSKEAKAMAEKLAEEFSFCGVYAIEMFLDKDGEIYVNEVSPRTHNSGHHTVSANLTSQHEQQIRIALGLPLGSVEQLSPCVLINLLGEGSEGKTNYVGLDEAFDIGNVQYTLYGKDRVRPKRKMGHALILEKDLDEAINKIDKIRNTLTITSYE